MKVIRGVLALFGISVLAPCLPIHAAQNSIEPSAPAIRIVSQPFNILTSVNSRFVLDPNLNSFVDSSDRIEFLLHRRLISRDSLHSIDNGDVQAGVTDSLSIRLSRVDRDYAGHLLPVVPIITEQKEGASLSIPFDGVYPLTIRIVDSATEKTLSTVLTYLNKRDPSVEVPMVPYSTLLHVSGSPSLSATGDLEISEDTREAFRRLISFFQTHSSPATISIEPEMLSALSESANPTDIEMFLALRDHLRQRSIAVATFAPVDPSRMATIGLGGEFLAQLRLGERTLNKLLPGVPIVRTAFVAQHRLNQEGMSLLHQAGITDVLLLPPAQKDANRQKGSSELARYSNAGKPSMSVTSAMTKFSSGPQDIGISSQRLIYKTAAEVLVERDDIVTKGVAIPTVRLVLPIEVNAGFDTTTFVAAAEAISASPGITSVDLAQPQIVDPSLPSVSFPKAPTAVNATGVAAIRAARMELNSISSMLGAEDPRRDLWPRLMGIGTSTAVADPDAYVIALRKKLRATRRAVTVTTPSSLTLSSHNGAVRLQIRNDSPEDLTVRLRLTSAKLNLVNPSRVITLFSGSTTEVSVNATTRTSGEFPINVWVATPVGNAEVVPLITITAKVTAIAGFGQLVSISLLLILLAWWWSHRRSARRERENPTTVSEQ
jgi:hypothetical protein